jgi:hypothetical protein
VAGPGIEADERPLDLGIPPPEQQASVQLRLDVHRVAPGGSLAGSVIAVNEGSNRIPLQLALTDFDAGTLATVSPAATELPAAGRHEIAFRITMDPRSRTGPSQMRLRVADPADPTRVYAEGLYAFDVQPPPSFARRYWWAFAAAGGLVLAALAWLWYRARRRAAETSVRHLVAVLSGPDGTLELPAPDAAATEFRFAIRHEDLAGLTLDRTRPGEAGYVVRRRAGGRGVTLSDPAGQESAFELGEPVAVGPETTPGTTLRIQHRPPKHSRRSHAFIPHQPDGGRTGALDDEFQSQHSGYGGSLPGDDYEEPYT